MNNVQQQQQIEIEQSDPMSSYILCDCNVYKTRAIILYAAARRPVFVLNVNCTIEVYGSIEPKTTFIFNSHSKPIYLIYLSYTIYSYYLVNTKAKRINHDLFLILLIAIRMMVCCC